MTLNVKVKMNNLKCAWNAVQIETDKKKLKLHKTFDVLMCEMVTFNLKKKRNINFFLEFFFLVLLSNIYNIFIFVKSSKNKCNNM